MNKFKTNSFRILYIFTLLLLTIPSVVNAEDTTSFSYKIKSVVNGADSALGGKAKYCYTYGCRSGNNGVKISTVGNNNGSLTVKKTKTKSKDSSNNVEISSHVKVNITDGFETLSTAINGKKINSDVKFLNFCDFLNDQDNGLLQTYQYEVLSENWSTYKILTNCADFDVPTGQFSNLGTFEQYKEYFKDTYIVMEPMISITTSDEKNQTASKAFSSFGVTALTDDVMQAIKNKGIATNSNIVSYVTQVMCASGASEGNCRAFVEASENANNQDLTNLVTAWNTVVNNFHTKNAETKTVKEWASWVMTGTNYRYVGADSTGKVLNEAKGKGSVSEKIADISWYLHLNEKIGPFTKVSSKATSWNNIVGMKNGYGIIVLKISINYNDESKYKCRYVEGKIEPPESKDKKDCCEQTDIWNDYEKGKSGMWQLFYNQTDPTKDSYAKICRVVCTKTNYDDLIGINNGTTTEKTLKKNLPEEANKDTMYCCYSANYSDDEKSKIPSTIWTNDGKLNIDYCKGTDTNNDKYCVWNGNNTERWQTINKELVDCCNYENWGKTNNEREQALKNADKNKTVTRYIFENEIPWYSNNCTSNITTQYCTIQKLQNGDTNCCHGTGNYSPSFINEMQSNGYSNTEAGLEEYLKYKIGVNKYNRLCGAPCSYEIESLCPDCSNEDTSYGLVMDKVSGFDSTALQLSNETEQCIFKNNEYLYEKNSYCEVYCTEKLEYSFPKKSTLSVTAGTRLVVGGNLSPMESESTITCRRTEINTAKFESDLKRKIDALKTAYKEYTYASVPLNENKINTTVIGSSKTDTRCECRNYQSGLEDGKCCDGKGTYTKAATLTNTTTFANTDTVYYDYSEPASSSSCSSQGGTWHPEDNTPIPNPNAGKSTTECVKYYTKGKNKGQCKEYGKEPETLPHTEPAYCSGYSPRPYCSGSFTYNGTTCVTTSSTANCSLSGNTWTCKDYSCSSTTSVGNETGTLTSASSFRTTESNPTCTYAYCSSRNYDRYNFQTVDSYNYAYNKLSTQAYQGKICENESGYYQTKYENLKETRKKALLAAWNDYNNVINNLNICYNFTNKVKSNYEININLSYQNGSYSIDTPLDKTVSTYTDKNFTQTESTRGYKNCGIMTGIEFLNCEQETKYYQENINGRYATGTSTNTYSYALPNNSSMYRYVNKSSLSEKDSNINSIYIGSHLPVAYNEKDNKIEVELTPSVIKSNLSGTTYITKQRNNFESEICTDPYACDAITPGKAKIIPVYRVISLNNPFPDEDGNGRNTGKNWCDGSDCTNNNQVVQNVIKNNRGVSEDKVYTLTPLYTLVLTPGTIKKIREYNSQTSYGDYSLICEKDTGKYCKSLYLRGEPDKEGNIIDNNLEQIGVLKKDKSCAFNEELAGCMPGDKYEG